ncbi:MAG: ornithine decarboxylase [Veillonella sp. oral taxon 158]|uniref:ornithine decarboxylase n=1 Tax=Veillonella sp. oral taxon 158 TaxID=671228 RepID=UPI00235454D4|nr:ornithine decarboxylase [Veillonella sp. oral taxon 158]MBS6449180.1 ornithine decarboxylase [Veillonella sp. oral taxon 158]
MKHLKIAFTDSVKPWISSIEDRTCIPINETDFTNIGAVVVSASEMDVLDNEQIRSFGIPAIVMVVDPSHTISFDMERIGAVIDVTSTSINDYKGTIEQIVASYEALILPPFFKALSDYVGDNNAQFDCPGHQGGQFFAKHPTGRAFFDFFGDHIFRADLCNADVKLGDLLIHEGYAHDAQAHAAAVYNADKTYFVLNGTSSANKVVLNALLTPGDIILYDRNNHKSICHGGLVMSGATPIYLETARNPFGSIGGILERCFDESYIRNLIGEKDPNKAKADRPIRLAVIQLGTYDGTIYNARQVVDKIGHLCDYIFFDSAWVGYEQFIPMMKDCSPLLLELGPNDPGILVTQSVHKQQAGFSQASQIHKKDKHIKGQDRYVDHKRFNNSFMMHASTSPFYPLFASLDVNAKMHEGELGKQLWRECIEVGIDARKSVLSHCKYLRPLVAPIVHGKKWEEGNTQEMANDVSYFAFEPNAKWHSFKGYGEGQYFIDPCKFQLITPGINVETGAYEDFGIHANILANYLRENRIIPEKCDLNTILFLMTPAESKKKMDALVNQLVRFEELIDRNAPMEEVLPSIYYSHIDKYKGYHIRQLCQEMHDFYKARNVSTLQQRLFSKAYFPEYVMNPQEANFEFQRNKGELVPLDEVEGRIALEGALPYPPGVLCVQPGERWSRTACDYFLALEEGINQLPGFAPEIQGVYLIEQPDGSKKAYGYVLKKEYEM